MSGIEFLLDTNVVIGLLKGHTPALALAEANQLTSARQRSARSPVWNCWGIPN